MYTWAEGGKTHKLFPWPSCSARESLQCYLPCNSSSHDTRYFRPRGSLLLLAFGCSGRANLPATARAHVHVVAESVCAGHNAQQRGGKAK